MIPNIGPLEVAVILIIALMVFGPRRLPELGSALGRSIRGFGEGVKGIESEADVPAGTPETSKGRVN